MLASKEMSRFWCGQRNWRDNRETKRGECVRQRAINREGGRGTKRERERERERKREREREREREWEGEKVRERHRGRARDD